MKKDRTRIILNIFSVIMTILCCIFIWYGMKTGLFTSEERMMYILNKFGIFAPLLFCFIQIIQVVIPIIPGGVTCIVGVLIFGPVWGFIYNYISIVAGSCINFVIAKRYGMKVLEKMFSEKTINKYNSWLESGKKFDKVFALAIFFPVAPDDFLCYLAGLTPMKFKTFLKIMIFCKPLSIFIYSTVIGTVLFNMVNNLLKF